MLLAQTSDFLPFPSLIPEFEFIKPYAHIIRSSEIVIFTTTAIVMVFLTFLIKFTKIGKAMRATAQDRDMAMLVGVDVNRVISVTFIVGSATAALGGVLIASHIGQINFYIGFIAGIKAFVAAVLGGIGSIPGAVFGSLVLGWTEGFFTGYVSSDYEDVFAFLFLVFILIFRPSGILGRSDDGKSIIPLLKFEEIKRSLLVSIWFMFLTFPIMVIRVNTVQDTIEWRWKNLLFVGLGSFVLSFVWRYLLKRKEAGKKKEEQADVVKTTWGVRLLQEKKFFIPALISPGALCRALFPLSFPCTRPIS